MIFVFWLKPKIKLVQPKIKYDQHKSKILVGQPHGHYTIVARVGTGSGRVNTRYFHRYKTGIDSDIWKTHRFQAGFRPGI